MRPHGKNYRKAAEKRELAKGYAPEQAIDIVKGAAFAKFDETVEVAVRLGVDPRHADQVVRGTVVLPAKGAYTSGRVNRTVVGPRYATTTPRNASAKGPP